MECHLFGPRIHRPQLTVVVRTQPKTGLSPAAGQRMLNRRLTHRESMNPEKTPFRKCSIRRDREQRRRGKSEVPQSFARRSRDATERSSRTEYTLKPQHHKPPRSRGLRCPHGSMNGLQTPWRPQYRAENLERPAKDSARFDETWAIYPRSQATEKRIRELIRDG